MKKSLKVAGITLAGILGVAVIAIIVVCYIVFTPARLTPIVRSQAEKYLTCRTELDTVDLTFFSSFPRFAIQVSDLALRDSATADTIASLERLSASVNLMQFLFQNNIVIDRLELYNGHINLVTDSTGRANYDIVRPTGGEETEEESDTTSSPFFDMLQINGVRLENINARYADAQSGMDASATGLSLTLDGNLQNADADIAASIDVPGLRLSLNDSSKMAVSIDKTAISADLTMRDNHIEGRLNGRLPATTFVMGSDTLANRVSLALDMPLALNMDILLAQLKQAQLTLNSIALTLDGSAQIRDSGDIGLDMNVATNSIAIDSLLALVPEKYTPMLSDFRELHGKIALNCRAEGVYNDSTMPLIDAALTLDDATVDYKPLPYRLEQTKADITASLDLNGNTPSTATINNLYAKTGTMWVSASGSADDLLGDPTVNASITGDINLPELKPVIPSEINIAMDGRIRPAVNARFRLSDIEKMNLEKISASGTIAYSGLDVTYDDSIKVTDSQGTISLNLPTARQKPMVNELADLTVKGHDLNFTMPGIEARIVSPELTVGVSNPLDTTKIPSLMCGFDIKSINASMGDTLSALLVAPKGHVSLSPMKKHPKVPSLTCSYSSDSLALHNGSAMDVTTRRISVNALSAYDRTQENLLLKWNPLLKVDFNDGVVAMDMLPSPVTIPAIKFTFAPRAMNITDSRIIVENSDFSLTGKVTNLRKFIKGEGLLLGELNFVSEQTDVDRLLAFVSGLGNDKTTETAENDDDETIEKEESEESSGPFMVPKGIDCAFNTHINKALFNGNEFNDVKGRLTVNDGKLVLEQMGFTSDAARMQLTGVYRSERENHLYAGLNFHLLDIDIRKLLDLVPYVDTVIPMLSSFEGAAQFHFVAETYLNSKYQPKISTLRGAAAIEGKDLVVLDSETFETISKYLMFSRKAKNVIDSLSVEMTVFRDEVDLYPFLISMDKWQAVLSGRYNLDNSYNCHISLTDCPLPVRLGLDIKGTPDDMDFKLVPCKYAALFKPKKKNEMQQRTLEMKNIITEALKSTVKEEGDDRI